MSYKIINPNVADPLDTWAEQHRAAAQAWLAAPAQAGMREISFDYVRANVAALANATDAQLMRLSNALGLNVSG